MNSKEPHPYHLWHGHVQEVLNYLRNNVEAKNGVKLQELIGYIEKHQKEIIDYDRRKKVGKEAGLEKEKDIDNQPPSNSKAFKKADSVKNACDNVIKRCQEDKFDTRMEQEREAIDSDVENQLSSNGAKKVVVRYRVEKACDSVVGKRQKHYAQSWSNKGSRSLAILKAVELNNKWLDIWFPTPIAVNELQQAALDPCKSEELELVA